MTYEIPAALMSATSAPWADRLERYQALVALRAKDGLTVAEFAEIALATMRLAVAAADESPMESSQKKDWVLEIVAAAFDQFAGLAVPVTLWPVWVIAKPALRALCLSLASGAIEFMLTVTRGNK